MPHHCFGPENVIYWTVSWFNSRSDTIPLRRLRYFHTIFPTRCNHLLACPICNPLSWGCKEYYWHLDRCMCSCRMFFRHGLSNGGWQHTTAECQDGIDQQSFGCGETRLTRHQLGFAAKVREEGGWPQCDNMSCDNIKCFTATRLVAQHTPFFISYYLVSSVSTWWWCQPQGTGLLVLWRNSLVLWRGLRISTLPEMPKNGQGVARLLAILAAWYAFV